MKKKVLDTEGTEMQGTQMGKKKRNSVMRAKAGVRVGATCARGTKRSFRPAPQGGWVRWGKKHGLMGGTQDKRHKGMPGPGRPEAQDVPVEDGVEEDTRSWRKGEKLGATRARDTKRSLHG